MNGQGALQITGVCKSFAAVEVLHQIELATQPGEFVTLLGPSGCGKTTLLRIVAGLETADAGSVRLDGAALDRLPAHQRPVNTVFQSYALFPHLSVFENVAFGLRSRRVAEPDLQRRVRESLELLELGALASRRPQQLSGGQRQRVALARALVNEPQVLLLDEPLSALDAKLRGSVQLELRRLQRELGRTFVLVTHDQEEALTVSDRIVVMERGRIAQVGPAAEVFRRPQTRFVASFLGGANVIPGQATGPRRVQTALGALALDEEVQGSVTLALHPRWVRWSAAAPAENGVQVRVRDAVFRGDHTLVLSEPAGELALRAALDPAAAPAAGASGWFELPREHLVLLRD
ncbi:MAG: ABC transporter ATP-binding protein [Planctomycetes bacterium]|nr:ABC transporter ATP-binding protein [Planctomycetota bacterium]